MTRQDELYAMPDRELDAVVAEVVMGWEWLERDDGTFRGKAIFPPERDGWVRWNYTPSRWRPASQDTEQFSDWFRCCAQMADDGYTVLQHGMPNFSTTGNGMLAVLERMRESGYVIETRCCGAEGIASVYFGGKLLARAADESLPRAVAIAAVLAVEVAK